MVGEPPPPPQSDQQARNIESEAAPNYGNEIGLERMINLEGRSDKNEEGRERDLGLPPFRQVRCSCRNDYYSAECVREREREAICN